MKMTNLLNEQEFNDIVLLNKDIVNETKEEIDNKITYLEFLGCNEAQIKNIIIANPFYLTSNINDIKELVYFLKKLDITNLNLTFDSNPNILNKKVDELRKYIFIHAKDGNSLKEIIDEIDGGIIDE